ncbi:MAG: hypothetical protein HY534_07950 [Chloroflexi bacterium]|nr:hypothetical protein [Chloroflexota bacterium]
MSDFEYLFLAAKVPASESFRPERCDECYRQVWLAPHLVSELDDAEEENLPSRLLCTDCAIAKYGWQQVHDWFAQSA